MNSFRIFGWKPPSFILIDAHFDANLSMVDRVAHTKQAPNIHMKILRRFTSIVENLKSLKHISIVSIALFVCVHYSIVCASIKFATRIDANVIFPTTNKHTHKKKTFFRKIF